MSSPVSSWRQAPTGLASAVRGRLQHTPKVVHFNTPSGGRASLPPLSPRTPRTDQPQQESVTSTSDNLLRSIKRAKTYGGGSTPPTPTGAISPGVPGQRLGMGPSTAQRSPPPVTGSVSTAASFRRVSAPTIIQMSSAGQSSPPKRTLTFAPGSFRGNTARSSSPGTNAARSTSPCTNRTADARPRTRSTPHLEERCSPDVHAPPVRRKTTPSLACVGLVQQEASQPAINTADALVELEEGDTVCIDGSELHVLDKLGEGSFASVWRAFGDRGKVAIKEILCRTPEQLSTSLMERDILEKLGKSCSTEGICTTPAILGSETSQGVESKMCRVRFAMTLLPGRQLDDFFGEQCRIPPTDPVDAYHQFFDAYHYARQLLSQLVPACARLSAIGRHRDISPRNILIDTATDIWPNFGLVDFGHAVNVEKWPKGLTSNNLAGDGRYWTVSAWYLFENGMKELEKDSDLYAEYVEHVDLHALGVTALETFVSMMPRLQNAEMECLSEDSKCADQVLISLRKLQKAWEHYWFDVSKYFKAVFRSCQSCKPEVLKLLQQAYKDAGVHKIIADNMRELCSALVELRQAYAQTPDRLEAENVPALLDALVLMIGTHDRAPTGSAWPELQSLLEKGSEATQEVEASFSHTPTFSEPRGVDKWSSPMTPVTLTPGSSICLQSVDSPALSSEPSLVGSILAPSDGPLCRDGGFELMGL